MNQMNNKEETLLQLDEKTLPIVRRISDRMPGGFFIYHADGDEELIFTNNALLRIFGCDTLKEFKELTGYTFPGMVHPEDLETVQRSIANQIATALYKKTGVSVGWRITGILYIRRSTVIFSTCLLMTQQSV